MNKAVSIMIFIALTALLSLTSEAKSEYSLEHITKSLVKIKVSNSDALLPDRSGIIESDYSYGTGFYISKDGLILTAKHVLDKRSKFNSDPITCLDMNNNQPFGPIIVFEDKNSDVALLRNPRSGKIKYFIDIFDDASKLKKGLECYCIGFPNEVQNLYKIVSFSLGEIEFIGKNLPGHEKLPYRKKVIVSSCDVVSGFSGGIIIDKYFLPIGLILGSIESNEGTVCFARRINQLRQILNDIR